MASRKILIADDESTIRTLLATALEAEGFVTLQATNGAEAVELIRQHDVILAILDVSMPVMDGIETLKEIQRIAPAVGILMVTGYLDFDPLIKTIPEKGALDYILKPFEMVAVKNAIKRAVAKQEMRRGLAATREELAERIHLLEKNDTERTFEFRGSQLRWRDMVERSRDMILVGRGGFIRYANPRAVSLSGYSEAELLKLPLVDIIHPDDFDRVMAFFRRHRKVEEVERLIRFRMLSKDRACFWVEMSLAQTLWEGKPAMLAVLRDISERIRAEENLRIKDLAIAASDNGFFFADHNGVITDINRSFLRIFGYESEEDVWWHSIQEFFHLPNGDKDRPFLETILAGGQGASEMKGRRKDGSIRDFHVSITLVKSDTGEPFCVMGSFSDITEQKRITELMDRSEKLTSLGRLAAGLAHELKNPLAVISSCAQFCLDNMQVHRSLQENLQVIFRNSRRANRLIEELLNFARPSRLLVKEVDINNLLSGAVEMAGFELQAHKTSFTMDLQTGLPRVSADEDKLKQVFLNVIMNAVQAIGGRGIVTIRTTLDENRDGIQVDIADDGPGIPPDYRQRIFDPFFSTKDGGTGLGLSICHSIVQEHGGEILVACPDSGGTCISICLSRAVPFPDAASDGRDERGSQCR